MPDFLAPGTFVAENVSAPISGVPLDAAAFVGPTHVGPFGAARLVTSVAEFTRFYGDDSPLTFGPNFLARAVRHFFDSGGARLFVARVRAKNPPGRAAYETALKSLDAIADFNLLAAPGSSTFPDGPKIADLLLAHAARFRRFAVLDSPPGLTPAQILTFRRRFDSPDAALIFPWIFDAAHLASPPSGFVCGTMARVERERGIWKSTAGESIPGAASVERELSAAEIDAVGAAGVNVLRKIAGRGIVLWTARTLSSNADWKYVSLRRFAVFLENAVAAGTQWAVFEPNGEELWGKIRQSVGDFLTTQWRAGALVGAKPSDAFFVRCDRTTMTQDDLNSGRMVVLIGVAPTKPAEFVIFRIGQWTADSGKPPT